MQVADVEVDGLSGPGLLCLPDGGQVPRGALVALPGAALPERDQVLFEHLARTVTPLGLAVLSSDRRPSIAGEDVPLEDQAADAEIGHDWLARTVDVPVGLYGFSQGAWVAVLVASGSPRVASLALVGFSGVSPAVQMRSHTPTS